MKLFNALRSVALPLMIGALGVSFNAHAAKHMAAEGAKPADAAKPAAAKPAAKKVAKKVAKKAPVKVVYHLNQGNENASLAMNNIKNHLVADPTAKIVVVTHGKGIDFLLKDAKDAKGSEFSKQVEELSLKGVDFRVCNNTLVGRKIEPTTVISEAKIVPAGVVEISNLQAHEGYVYVKP
jgi:intracellular sulfur oxidation DsrE/DsrF family protein